MAFLDEIGVCNESGCEAFAMDTVDSYTIVARSGLFDDFDMSSFALDAQLFRGRMARYLTSTADIARLQWLAGVTDRTVAETMALDQLIEFFARRVGSEIGVFLLPKAAATREQFLAEASRPSRTRLPTVTETAAIESSQTLFQMTIDMLSPALRARLTSYTDPASILMMATVFVAVVAFGSTPPFNGLIIAAMWALIGWQAFSIGRMLGDAIGFYIDGDLRGCARRLADIIVAIGEVFIFLLMGLAARFIRPAARTPPPPRPATPLAPTAATAIAGAETVLLSEAEYFAAMRQVFPSQYVDRLARLVALIGQESGVRAMANPQFVAALRAGNWRLAGTLFHSAAAAVARVAGPLPPGWTLAAEEVLVAGRGGSRIDLLLRGPAGEIAIFDWKTTGVSALRSIAQMDRYAGVVEAEALGRLTTVQSVSWVDFIRPMLNSAGIVLR